MDLSTISNPVLNVGREVCVSVTPLFNDEPIGWGGVSMAFEPDGLKLLAGPPQQEGLNFFVTPLPRAFGQVKGSVVFDDGGKVILRVPFEFTLVVPPGKAKPSNALISVTLAPPPAIDPGGDDKAVG